MPQGRKILYFLGAGASYGAGASASVQGGGSISIPTQANFWEIFLRFSTSPRHRKLIESFLFRYFLGYARVPARSKPRQRRKLLNGIDVEEVFTFLSERVRAPSTSTQLRAYAIDVWDALVAEVGNVFTHFNPTQRTRQIYRMFLRNHVRARDVIVSFNYDTIFERSLPGNKKWAYEGIQDCTSSLRILKPHGSINWELDGQNIEVRPSTPARCVVVAPTHLKFISGTGGPDGTAGYLDEAAPIQDVWRTMEGHMREAKALIFMGYSFPSADLYFSSVLRSVLAARSSPPSLVLVNPDAVGIAERLVQRFSISPPLRFFDLQQFAQSTRNNVLQQLV